MTTWKPIRRQSTAPDFEDIETEESVLSEAAYIEMKHGLDRAILLTENPAKHTIDFTRLLIAEFYDRVTYEPPE